MPTLQDLRKRTFPTIKAFAAAYGCSATKASGILRGLYHLTLSTSEVERLARVLGVSFVVCADACDETFAALKRYKKGSDDWKRTARTHKGIWERWRFEEEIRRGAQRAAATGDWRSFRQRYLGGDWQKGWEQARESSRPAEPECFVLLGIAPPATREQIIQAFRAKVRQAHDGNGGFRGDMDQLTRAKEQALAYKG